MIFLLNRFITPLCSVMLNPDWSINYWPTPVKLLQTEFRQWHLTAWTRGLCLLRLMMSKSFKQMVGRQCHRGYNI